MLRRRKSGPDAPEPARTNGRERGGQAFPLDEALMAKLEYLHVVAKKAFAGSARGERRARRIGAGLEFADYRRYSPGDDFRNIDWNVYARLGRLLVRLYEEEEDLYVTLLVDTSASMALGDGGKLDYARRVAAALAYVALANLDRVSVVPFADELGPRHPPARGKAQIWSVFASLEAIAPGGPTRFGDAMRAFVHQSRRRGLAVVLSDFYAQDGYEEGLNLLRYHRFEPFAIQIADERELRPRLRGDVTLVDCETGTKKDVTVTPRLLARYQEACAAFSGELAAHCLERRIPHFRAPVQVPFEDLVLRIFRAGGFLG